MLLLISHLKMLSLLIQGYSGLECHQLCISFGEISGIMTANHKLCRYWMPLAVKDRIPEITEARNIELGLGLQLCFMHPSKYKFERPLFCFELLEYVGQKIQDLIMAERLLMKHLDAPGRWLQ